MSKRHSLVITSVWGGGEGAYYHLVSREAKDAAKPLTTPTAGPMAKNYPAQNANSAEVKKLQGSGVHANAANQKSTSQSESHGPRSGVH